MKLYVTIRTIDHNGFNGRGLHPTNDMERENFEDDADYAYYVITGVLDDGRRVELIDFEVEPKLFFSQE
jgi:hypothetical protein